MTIKKYLFSISFVLMLGLNLLAQENESAKERDNFPSSVGVTEKVDDAFSKLIKESNNYQSYKVVKLNSLLELQRSTKKEISDLESAITELNSQIEDLQGQVDRSKAELDQTNSTLKQVEKSKDEFSFIGIKMMKTTYQVIVIVIIVILLILLIVFIGRFKAGNSITIKARNDLEDLQNDYDEYRKKALETQQRLGRQLQDERNKNMKN